MRREYILYHRLEEAVQLSCGRGLSATVVEKKKGTNHVIKVCPN